MDVAVRGKEAWTVSAEVIHIGISNIFQPPTTSASFDSDGCQRSLQIVAIIIVESNGVCWPPGFQTEKPKTGRIRKLSPFPR